MATIVADAAGGDWTTGATWVGGVAPTAADDAQLVAASGNVTVTAGAVCRSLDCLTYTGTLTHTAAITLTIGDATAGAGNRALRMVAGMTYTLGSTTTSAITFASTSATTQTVDYGGKTAANTTFSGAGSSYQLTSAFTGAAAVTQTIAHTAGTLDWNGQTVSLGVYSSTGATTRADTFGAAAITMIGSTWTYSGSNFSITGANTSTITVTRNSATVTFDGAGLTFYNLVVAPASNNSVTFNLNGANSFNNLSVTPGNTALCLLQLSANQTVTGTFTATGPSAGKFRPWIRSATIGTARTITAAALSLTNVDFSDITAAGAGTWSGTSVGNATGNTGITFTAPVTRFKVGGTGNWSSTTMWATSTGGASGASVPICHDQVFVDANSGAGTFTIDGLPRICAMNWTNAATATYAEASTGIGIFFYGSVIYNAGVAGTYSTNTKVWTVLANSTFTSATKQMQHTFSIGQVTLSDDLTATNTLLVGGTATLIATTQNVTCPTFQINTTTCTVTMGSGTWTVTSTGVVWNISQAGTINAQTSTIAITDTGASSKTFQGLGLTYNNVLITTGGAGAVIFTGANTFASMLTTGGTTKTITLPAATTTTLTTNSFFGGAAGNLITVNSSSAGSAALLSSPVRITTNYISMRDNSATGAGPKPFLAGENSTLVSNTPGWSLLPPGGGTMMMMGV